MTYVAVVWQINHKAISGVEVEVEAFEQWDAAEMFLERARASGWSGRIELKTVLPDYVGNTIAKCRDFSV